MATFSWPAVLRPHSISFWVDNASRSGGVALNGMEQTVSSGASRWRADIHFPIRTKGQVLAYRALMARLDGRVNDVTLPIFDGKRTNWPVDTYGRILHPSFTRRKQLDGTIYEDPEVPTESQIVAVIAGGAAAIGATQMGIRTTYGEPLQAGHYFGIVNRLHVVRTIVSTVGNLQTVTFRPPLRSAVVNGDPVEMSRPVCRMKLVSDDQSFLLLEQMRFADKVLQFVEAY